MDIVFIRHGRTSINQGGRFGGALDTDISQEGIDEITDLKSSTDKIIFDSMYTSPLKRARKTSEILGGDFIVDERLREMNFGIFEGLNYSEICDRYPDENKRWCEDFLNYRVPGGESLDDVFKRTRDFIESVDRRQKKVMAVTHGGIIRCALSLALGSSDYFYKFQINHSMSCVVSIDAAFMFIKAVNCTRGLKEVLS